MSGALRISVVSFTVFVPAAVTFSVGRYSTKPKTGSYREVLKIIYSYTCPTAETLVDMSDHRGLFGFDSYPSHVTHARASDLSESN